MEQMTGTMVMGTKSVTCMVGEDTATSPTTTSTHIERTMRGARVTLRTTLGFTFSYLVVGFCYRLVQLLRSAYFLFAPPYPMLRGSNLSAHSPNLFFLVSLHFLVAILGPSTYLNPFNTFSTYFIQATSTIY
jgi:hypothetical protein